MYKLSFNNAVLIDGSFVNTVDEKKFLNDIKLIVAESDFFIKNNNGYTTYSFYCNFLSVSFKYSIIFFNSKIYGEPYLIYCEKNGGIDWVSDINVLRGKTDHLKNIFLTNRIKLVKFDDDVYEFLDNGVHIQLYPSPPAMGVVLSIKV